MAGIARETCRCGAQIEVDSSGIMADFLMRDFRAAHEACRRATSKEGRDA